MWPFNLHYNLLFFWNTRHLLTSISNSLHWTFHTTHLSQWFLHWLIFFFCTLLEVISPFDLTLTTLASKFCEFLCFKFHVQAYTGTSNWRFPLHPAFCSSPTILRQGLLELRCSRKSTRFGVTTPGFNPCPDI